VRKIRAETTKLVYWPLPGTSLRLIGYPDAAFKNNEDKSSQRGQVIFMATQRQRGVKDAFASLIDFESTKIKTQALSTTVAELHAFMKCFGTCQFLRGLWMDMSSQVTELHMRTDAKNLVTTAATTHLPEQKETIHMITTLRQEVQSGAIDDMAHVVSSDMLSDCLTKASVKADNLIKAVVTGTLPNADAHMPFREMLKYKHKAYMANWLVKNIPKADQIVTFFGRYVQNEIMLCRHIKSPFP